MLKVPRNNAEKKKKRGTTRKWFNFSKVFTSNNIRTFVGLVFVVVGFLFLYKVPVIDNSGVREPIIASREFKSTNDSQVSRILLPKVNIDLKVIPAKIVGPTWETSENSASHGEGSANPGEKGNTVIFAHAKEGLFYNLKDVKKGDIVYVLTKNQWYRYKVNEVKSVVPKDITTVAPAKIEILTLFTCSGFFDEKRLIVKAIPLR